MSSLNDFKLEKILGKGAYSVVLLVHRILDGQTYAMKQVRINQLSDKEKQNSLNEIRILASLSHKNIIGYKDAFFDEKSKTINIVMEYANNGDISQKIRYNLKHGLLFRENIIWNYLIQTLEGLHYLHEHNIIHRDLKSANIFLTQDGTVKIGDLNVSKIAKIGMASTQTGTPYYASPEIWLDKPYDFKSDVWSLGCILYELCQLKPPFRGTSLKNLCYNIQRGIYEPIMNFYSEELKNIINLMLRTDPNMRPSTGQILRSRIIMNKKKELKLDEELDRIEMEKYDKRELIGTIKMPRNLKEINGNLPKDKYNKNKKNNEDMMKEDEYETNKRLKGFLNDEDKKEIQKLYGKNNSNNSNNPKKAMLDNNNNNYKNNNYIKEIKDNYNNNGIQLNIYSDNNRINNIIRNKQKIFNKNINNSNRIYLNNDLTSIDQQLDNTNNKDDLISLNYDLIKNKKKIISTKFKRNMSDVEDNNNYKYKKNKMKANKEYKNVDDYISQNINIYNNINKYYYKNYFDLMSYNDYKRTKNINVNNLNNNYPKKFSNIDLIKNKINSDKSPSKYNYIFNKGNHFNNIQPENKMNNSTNNDDSYINENKNFKLLMNNNFNPNININIYSNKEDKRPNLNNMDYIDNYSNKAQFKLNISPKKEELNKKPILDIKLLESSNKKEKESFYLLNDINNNIRQYNNKKMYLQKLKTDNNDYIDNNKMNKNKFEFFSDINQSDTESLNSQIIKLKQYENNNKKKQYNKYINKNNQGKIVSSKTPKLKIPKKNTNRKKFSNNNQLSSKENINNNNYYSNLLLNNQKNIISNNNNHQKNYNIKKPNLVLNFENYQPRLYVGIGNKYRNDNKNNNKNNYISYPTSDYKYDNMINNKFKLNGLYLENISNKNRNYNPIGRLINKNKSEYLKILNNNLVNLNENNNSILNNNDNYIRYKKQNNYIQRMTNNESINKNRKRPISSIVQRKIENSLRYKKYEPSYNNQINRINNKFKLDDSLDQINNMNNIYSKKNNNFTEANNINYIRLNNHNYINNNNDLINYRNKVKKNKLEIINNFNNYYKNHNKNDYRKIDNKYNKPEQYRNINNNNNKSYKQRVITPSPDILYKRKTNESAQITNKYRLKRLNGKIGESNTKINDYNGNYSNIPTPNKYNNIDKIEVQIHPKRKAKVIIEKYNYQPIKKRKNNQNKISNNNMNKFQYYMNENNNINKNKIFEKYNSDNNYNYLNQNEYKNYNQINYLNYNDYNYNILDEIKYGKKNNINENIYSQQNKYNNFIFDSDLNEVDSNNKDYNNILNNNIYNINPQSPYINFV